MKKQPLEIRIFLQRTILIMFIITLTAHVVQAVVGYSSSQPPCWEIVPGYVTINFKDTASVDEVRDFVKKTLRGEYLFRVSDFKDPNFDDDGYQNLLREDSWHNSIDLTAKAEPWPRREKEETLARPAAQLAHDHRVKRVHHDLYGQLYAVEFQQNIPLDKFFVDNKELMALPSYIRVEDRYFKHAKEISGASLSPTTKFFVYHTLGSALTFIESLKDKEFTENNENQITVSYNLEDTFTIRFPSRYSSSRIIRLFQELAGETLSRSRLPVGIALGLRVGKGKEDRWIKELAKYALVKEVVQPKLICVELE